ncbi:MAG: sensor histidine kinase [Terracidiphilus sp.]|jgi:signal transduction histidine kinase
MQQTGLTEVKTQSDEMERKRVEAVVETLAAARGKGESLAAVAHDARNMVTALTLYCDLLEEPGVLEPPFLRYGSELRLVAAASRRLVEKLVALDTNNDTRDDTRETPRGSLLLSAPRPSEGFWAAAEPGRAAGFQAFEPLPAPLIDNFAAELTANRNLLAALAGPALPLTMKIDGSALPVMLTGEDLTRILVNLVKNAAEATPPGGRIALELHEFHNGADETPWLVLTVEDNGSGISLEALEEIFIAGYTTRSSDLSKDGTWPATHRGLGLSITRSILEAAGGQIVALNRDAGGARFIVELPVRRR